MDTFKTNQCARRTFVAGTAAIAVGLMARPVQAALARTPRQSLGPFYPVDWAGETDADLVRVAGEAAQALGQVTYVSGRITDRSGKPLAGAAVEIWQCDANGRYHHPGDTRGSPADSGFQGQGRVLTDAAGAYRFRTIRPVPYSGRTAHIHFKVAAKGHDELVTQMYVAGEPRNETDFLLNSIADERVRERLIVRLDPADRLEPGALAGNFNIVMA